MTDPIISEPYPLGAIQSPPDDRDWTVDALYALAGIDPVPLAATPAVYRVPAPLPSHLIQLGPTCVPYGDAWLKQYEDLRDTGPFTPAFTAFFNAIGGGPNGADPRRALQQLVDVGYPSPTSAASMHRIAAYWAVPITEAGIKDAIMAFGPIGFSVPWSQSWFNPGFGGVLPPYTTLAGGHWIIGDGWDNARGLRWTNTWGTGWGEGGDCYLPWSQLDHVWNVWKAQDRVVAPVKPLTYRVHIAHGAHVRTYAMPHACLTDQRDEVWTSTASSAPCKAPRSDPGCNSGRAVVALVTAGKYIHRYIRIGGGVTLTHS